jgi:tetratricopeptide (TPR) repeat protein
LIKMLTWRHGGNSNHAREISVCVFIISAATAGRSRYPISSVAEAERANQRALQAGAPRYSSGEYQGYQAALGSAHRLLAEQQQRWVFRSYGSAVALLEQARKLAESAATKATEECSRRRVDVEEELRQFEKALQIIQEGGAGVAQLALMRRSLLKAEISLATAKSQWEAGNYDAASSKLRSEAEAVRFLEEVREAFVRRTTDPRLLSMWNRAVKATINFSMQTGEYAIIINKYRQTLSLLSRRLPYR